METENYEELELEIIRFGAADDVIVTSGNIQLPVGP